MKGTAIIKPDEIRLKYYESMEKTATQARGGSGSVIGKLYVPKAWIGKKVVCLLVEPPDEED